jgi:hypothetical protein
MSIDPLRIGLPSSGTGRCQRRTGILVAVSLVAALCGTTPCRGADGALTRPGPAGPWHGDGLPMTVVSMQPTRTLDPVTSGELMDGPQELSISMPSGAGRSATMSAAKLAPTISRRVPDLWQVRLSGESTESDLQVSYELVSEGGHTGCLSHAEAPGQQLNARLQPIGPTSRRTAGDRVLVSGGVDLVINALQVQVAGEYRGTIQITINQL